MTLQAELTRALDAASEARAEAVRLREELLAAVEALRECVVDLELNGGVVLRATKNKADTIVATYDAKQEGK